MSAGRLVVVTNRMPSLGAGGGGARVSAGGMASALLDALRARGGGLWLGWSGEVSAAGEPPRLRAGEHAGVRLVGTDLTKTELGRYYNGFCNGALWPLLHSLPERARIDPADEARYRAVNARFADLVAPRLRTGDLVWVHDYHLLLLGHELRRRGWRGRVGFFLHVPFPPCSLFRILPAPREYLDALLDYDVVGFHVHESRLEYLRCLEAELHARVEGDVARDGARAQRVILDPIGIDPEAFSPRAAPAEEAREALRGLRQTARGRRVVLGVDRLDYTKGIPQRVEAFEKLLQRWPSWRGRVSLVQVAAPSRTKVRTYVELKRRVDALVGRVNGEHSRAGWQPIHYHYRSYPRDVLAAFYREAAVGIVTPLRDGMNLVAKEYVAAQDPADPGVLLLSRFAGAAEELAGAVLVNPWLPDQVAGGLARALAMPLAERRARHAELLARVRGNTAGSWAGRFLDALAAPARAPVREAAPAGGGPRPAPRPPSAGRGDPGSLARPRRIERR